ncbi:MAG: hypothetical protein R2752_11295 [Vicinamibacterales bacterium]
MQVVLILVGACVASALAVRAAVEPEAGRAIAFGMLGPLVAVVASWLVVRRVHARAPGRVTAVMVQAFAGKVVFFGIYVVVVLKVIGVALVPFAVSFTGYFLALYVVEAALLQRLLRPRDEAPGSSQVGTD